MKFKKRYILGKGFPWAVGLGPYQEIQMRKENIGSLPINLNWPKELWDPALPRYRLVLERIGNLPRITVINYEEPGDVT